MSPADTVRSRMLKLAAARRTGVLRVSGDAEGAIHFSQGQVVFARSQRTPGPLRRAGDHQSPGGYPPSGGEADGGGLALLQDVLVAVEPVVDAVVDLLSGPSVCRRFRTTDPPPNPVCSIAVSDLLAEVARQQRQLEQMSSTVTPDTVVRRSPQLEQARVQVSKLQWALLIRVRHGATPRELARELDRTVSGTTADIYGLIVLGLLYADHAAGQREA